MSYIRCIFQLFTCHRCGEAFESLEEMQTHKLCHDTILNSLKDGSNSAPPQTGVAKFSLGVQKSDQSMNKYDFIRFKPNAETSAADDKKDLAPLSSAALKIPTTLFVPANLDNVSSLTNKLIMENMEKMAQESADAAELQKKYEDELMQLNADAKNYQDQMEVDRKKDDDERAKIAQAFTIKLDNSTSGGPVDSNKDVSKATEENSDSGLDNFEGKETTHIVNGDGMAMFILPTLTQPGKQDSEKDDSDMETEESEQNSSKDSSGINREGDDERDEEDGNEKMDDSGVADIANGDVSKSEDKISTKPEGYTKPCPRSKKPGYVPIAAKPPDTKTVSSEDYKTQAPRSLLSNLNPKLNELIKAKVEQNMNQVSAPQKTFILSNTQAQFHQPLPKLTLIPNVLPGKIPQTTYQAILPAPSSSSVTLAAVAASVAGQSAPKKVKTEDAPKLVKCEHCCIWFEDNAMSMLHNTLHSADSSDPFTCRKCYKKLGNRLEFMAHMIWHLEPNMDI